MNRAATDFCQSARPSQDEICYLCGQLIPQGTWAMWGVIVLSELPYEVRRVYRCWICTRDGREE
jgi:hypothetical protein